MSQTDQRWVLGTCGVAKGNDYPGCGITDTGTTPLKNGVPWENRVMVYANNQGEANLLAAKIAAILNADEELHRGTR